MPQLLSASVAARDMINFFMIACFMGASLPRVPPVEEEGRGLLMINRVERGKNSFHHSISQSDMEWYGVIQSDTK
jgi:hypothetical protein